MSEAIAPIVPRRTREVLTALIRTARKLRSFCDHGVRSTSVIVPRNMFFDATSDQKQLRQPEPIRNNSH
jgi:hypothetical protein